jgi:pyrroline-5-carboxylate reductase
MRISVIGGGYMGEALVSGLLKKEVAQTGDIVVSDVSAARRDHLKVNYGLMALDDNRAAVEGSDVVVLAVKPQQAKEVFQDLRGQLSAGQLAVSIMAGVPLARITTELEHASAVRVMPNMLAEVGWAMSVWTATGAVNEEQRGWVRKLLQSVGREVEVPDEKYIDMATALSGSGPAYFFLVIEALIDAGVHIGLPRELAQELVLQTAAGSAIAVRETGRHPAALRNAVTSPGGTTAAALRELEGAGVRAAFLEAVIAAHQRSQELG